MRIMCPVVIPYLQLDPQTLSALIEEFVTRDGAVHGHADISIDNMTDLVREQLRLGTAQIIYNEEDQSWTIVRKE
jgi:uncharacterized protein YheU (UPF0270 family)